jgi:hypothetical protein
VKDHQDNSYTRPLGDPHKEIPTKVHSNPTTEKSSKNTSENHIKEKPSGLKDLAQDLDEGFTMNHLAISSYKPLQESQK